jgi:hypothetical protein
LNNAGEPDSRGEPAATGAEELWQAPMHSSGLERSDKNKEDAFASPCLVWLKSYYFFLVLFFFFEPPFFLAAMFLFSLSIFHGCAVIR